MTTAQPTHMVIIFSLFLSTAIGWYLAFVYHLTYTGKKENRGQMVYTLVLLCLGGALVWLIVAENIVRAFGLAGALAMIRYRTRMQDPKDTTMVFFAIILGMACGLHQYFIALFGAAFIGMVLWIIKIVNDKTSLSRPKMPEHRENASTGDERHDERHNGDDGVVIQNNIAGEPAEHDEQHDDQPQ